MASDTRTIRVLSLIDSLTWGGAESLLADLAFAAPAAGLELSVAQLRDVDGSPSAQRLREAGVEPVVLGTGRLSDPRSLLKVLAHLRSERPDIVHTHLDAADVLGGVAARSLGIPVVSTVHLAAAAVSDDPGLRGGAKRALTVLARCACDDQVLVVSDAARRGYLARTPFRRSRVRTVHNGIREPAPPVPADVTRASLGIAPDAVIAVMVAVLRPGKGHDVAAEAVSRLRVRHPNLTLLIVGDGPSRAEVERIAEPLGSHAVLTGHRDDVADLLAASDVLLHPTTMDAFPTSLIEAAAASLPVVATAVGGIPEIVDDERTGLLVDKPDAGAVEHALGRLLDSPELRARLGTAAREHYSTFLSAERWVAELRDVYTQCLRSGTPRRSHTLAA